MSRFVEVGTDFTTFVRLGATAKGVTKHTPGGHEHDQDNHGRRGDVTETEAFRRWFGESEVVDENGDPLVVYHGTNVPGGVEEFRRLSHFGTAEAANARIGDLTEFSEVVGRDPGTFAIQPVYLKIENALELPDLASIGLDEEGIPIDEFDDEVPSHMRAWESIDDYDLRSTLLERGIIDIDEFGEWAGGPHSSGDVYELLETKGYDGIRYTNEVEDVGSESWIIFKSTQVKSATGNRGTFDPNDPDITKGVTSQRSLWINAKAPQEALPGGEVVGFRRLMVMIFTGQLNEILRDVQGWQPIITDTKWLDQITDASRPFIQEAIKTGGQAGIARVPGTSSPFDVFNPRVQEFIDTYTVRLATSVQGTREHQLSRIIGGGLEEGESIGELSGRVQEWGGSEVSTQRAEMIARTESARAYVAGEEVAWQESGVVRGKRWLLAPEPCEFCRAVANTYNNKSRAPVPLGQPFLPKGSVVEGVEGGRLLLDYDDLHGPPLHPHCRCDLIPILEGEA